MSVDRVGLSRRFFVFRHPDKTFQADGPGAPVIAEHAVVPVQSLSAPAAAFTFYGECQVVVCVFRVVLIFGRQIQHFFEASWADHVRIACPVMGEAGDGFSAVIAQISFQHFTLLMLVLETR